MSTARPDLDQQKFSAACERRRRHDEWLQKHQELTRMNRASSKARLLILVDEAYRLEKLHLGHQWEHCKNLIGMWRNSDANHIAASPKKAILPNYSSSIADMPENQMDSSYSSCPCTRAFSASQLQPKFRALQLLMRQFPGKNVEASFEAVRSSYQSDDDMLVDLMDRYGPESPHHDISIRVWLANVEQRLATLPQRWRAIRRKVATEMSQRDNSAMVIRCLSVMRIFVEGSQSETYGVDVVDRNKRDSIHQALLDELLGRNTLFL